ncbi:3-oxoacyl-[acyl-carrier-protein] reductase FabG [Colletotrichum liriopes]|uniref:3-oxoacyl-[acyl-carrier-protein] reductase FabG n=1 Tax=Colletotrichum liriopes TaxID=708192 RepID=A0AA37GHA5_9PEZI|nr:3-oxoacyl-[acyl-carrier-protein] reductase FabG [Colletotrichum liriopes]
MGYSTDLLSGEVGIVTGAGSPYGIGRSLVLSLALAGAKAVYATDLTLANIPSLQQEVKDAGSLCHVHGAVLDVASEDQTIAVLKNIIAEYGRLDFYFANAGFGNYKYEWH